jgi:hypothetical protein
MPPIREMVTVKLAAFFSSLSFISILTLPIVTAANTCSYATNTALSTSASTNLLQRHCFTLAHGATGIHVECFCTSVEYDLVFNHDV